MKEWDRDREEVVRKLKESLAGIPAGRVLSEELMAERREEARRENREENEGRNLTRGGG